MVSFFGIKFGEKKKKSDNKSAARGKQQQPHEWKRIDQNLLGEGQLFGQKIHTKGVVNGSIRSVSRAGTPSNASPFLHPTHNLAAVSMFDLSNKAHSRNGSFASSLNLRAHASDINLRTRFAANNGSSHSLAIPAPGFGSRPATANGKIRPWVNPLDVHFVKSTTPGPPTPKTPLSPLAHGEMTLPPTSKDNNADARSVFGEEADDMVDAVMASVKKKEEEAKEAKRKEREFAKEAETARLTLEGLERQKSTETIPTVIQPTQPRQQAPQQMELQQRPPINPTVPGPMLQQRPANDARIPSPVFRGNIEQRPGSRNGARGNAPAIRPGPSHHGPPRHGPPTQGLPHLPNQGPGQKGTPHGLPHGVPQGLPPGFPPGPLRQGPQMPSDGSNTRGPRPAGPPQGVNGPRPTGHGPQGRPYSPNPQAQGPHDVPAPHHQGRPYSPNPHAPESHRAGPPQNQGPGPYNVGPQPQNKGPPSHHPGPVSYHTGPIPRNASPSPYHAGPSESRNTGLQPQPQAPGSHNVRSYSPNHQGPGHRGPSPAVYRTQSPVSSGLAAPPKGYRSQGSGLNPASQAPTNSSSNVRIVQESDQGLRPSPVGSLSMRSQENEDDEENGPVEQFARPVIQDVQAKRDTYTMNSPRRISLSMKIEKLEKTLLSAQHAQLDKARVASMTSSYYSSDEEGTEDDSIMIIQPAPLRISPPPAAVSLRQPESPPRASSPTDLSLQRSESPMRMSPPPILTSLAQSESPEPSHISPPPSVAEIRRPESPMRGFVPGRGTGPRRPTLEEYGVSTNQVASAPRSGEGAGSSPATTGSTGSGSSNDFLRPSEDNEVPSSESRSTTPQSSHRQGWARDTAPVLPNPIISSGFNFNFDFGPNVAPPTPDSTTWSLGLSPESPIDAALVARPKPKLDRPHIPPALHFNIPSNAFSRDNGPWTPPLRSTSQLNAAMAAANDGRPSTAAGVYVYNEPVGPPSRSRTPVDMYQESDLVPDMVDAEDAKATAAYLGIGLARGLSVRESPAQYQQLHRRPSPHPLPENGTVDSFGTGFI
ncbi:hypothetical protein B0H63DRAFT_292076 [Podospora didyma]|uniref:Uncharacterized protein n=1 Tax=Podospora didyma TaxID=330526 RepID=A0AAE0KA14_9PEZI|nr:hypothetical protein B0H63DRAFT_292076 [Podospora didyma]